MILFGIEFLKVYLQYIRVDDNTIFFFSFLLLIALFAQRDSALDKMAGQTSVLKNNSWIHYGFFMYGNYRSLVVCFTTAVPINYRLIDTVVTT